MVHPKICIVLWEHSLLSKHPFNTYCSKKTHTYCWQKKNQYFWSDLYKHKYTAKWFSFLLWFRHVDDNVWALMAQFKKKKNWKQKQDQVKAGEGYTNPHIQTDLISLKTSSSNFLLILFCKFFFKLENKHTTMDYDYRNKSGGPSYPRPMYGPPSTSPSPSSNHPMYGYPKIGQQTGPGPQFFSPPERNSSFQHNTSPSCKSCSDLEFGFTRIW